MKEFFYIKENKKVGPFNFDELKKENIEQDTLIWYQGIKDWTNACEIDDLGELFKYIPPPIPNKKAKLFLQLIPVLNLTCIVSTILSWDELDSIVATVPIVAVLSLITYYFSRYHDETGDRFTALFPLIISTIGVLILVNISGTEAEVFIPRLLTIGTVVMFLLSVDKLRKLTRNFKL
tara:strand:+ start:173 stop:706 length:534 start_codon:yes stop_codon:yes gene_type:complete